MKVRTRHDLPADEVISTLQKEIRRGNCENAVLAAYEMITTSTELEEWLWQRLLVISVEDICMGDPMAPILVNSLYQQHLASQGRAKEADRQLFAIHAVRYLCASRKDRSSDEMRTWLKMLDERGELKLVIPEYAADMHTARGQKIGRGLRYFFEEGARLNPELPGRDKTYRERVLELLKESE
jgi:replication-associated recombination protein RarA